MTRSTARAVLVLFCVFAFLQAANAQSTEITYQGQLQSSSTPANGSFDFEFVLYDGGGAQIGPLLSRNGVAVANGIFSVKLDFGASFPGATRLLEIHVRPAGVGAFTTLSPRQPITSSPYSIKTLNADTATNATNAQQLGGVAANQYLQLNGSGAALTNLDAGSVATGTLDNARLGQLPTANIADNAVTAPKIASGQVVKSLNGLTDSVTLAGSGNITVTPTGNTLTIGSSVAGVGGSGTANIVPLWSAGTTLGNSAIFQLNGNIGIGKTNPTAKVDVSGGLLANNPSGAGLYGIGSSAGVVGQSNGSSVVANGGVQGSIAFNAGGTSWFQGDTTPLSNTFGTGVIIGNRSNRGYVAAVSYPFAGQTLTLNEDGGNVAIGTTSASSGRLAINGGPPWTTFGWTSSLALNNGAAVAWSPNPSGSSYGIGHTTGGTYFFRTLSAPGSQGSGVVYNMFISDNDLVGIGTVSPDSTLTVNGGASKASGGTTWSVFSDERLKNVKGNFTPGLEALMKLQPIRYQYKSDNPLGLKVSDEAVGFSAQAVAKVLPQAVTTSSKGYLQLNSDPILWTMLNAIKEQQTEIEAQNKRIDQLIKQNGQQQRQIKNLTRSRRSMRSRHK